MSLPPSFEAKIKENQNLTFDAKYDISVVAYRTAEATISEGAAFDLFFHVAN